MSNLRVSGVIVMSLVGTGCAAVMQDMAAEANKQDHVIKQNEYVELGASRSQTFEFTLAGPAAVRYSITDRSKTDSDHWDVAFIPGDEAKFFVNAQPYRAVALHENVSSVQDRAELPVGDHVLGVKCRNTFEKCQFSFDLIATY